MRKILFIMNIEILVFGSIGVLYMLGDYEYKKAVIRCGERNNLVINHTSTGDRYYTCKNNIGG